MFDILRCLVKELGANLNQRGEYGVTALKAGAYLGNHDTIRYLVVELGADISIPNKLGQTPLYSAAAMGHLAVV
jgi:ankyrin repeat protein